MIVRADDNPVTIKERLRVVRENTAPVVDQYAAQGKLVRVESSRDPEVVYADIVAGIGS